MPEEARYAHADADIDEQSRVNVMAFTICGRMGNALGMGRTGGVALAVVCAFGATVALPSGVGRKATTCGPKKVTLLTNGKRSCVAAQRLRPAAPTVSFATQNLQRELQPPLPLRLKNGKLAPNPVSPGLARAVLFASEKGERDATAAVRAALGQTQKARVYRSTAEGGTTVSVTDPAGNKFTYTSTPATRNADGTATAGDKFRGTAPGGDFAQENTVTGRPNADGSAGLDFGRTTDAGTSDSDGGGRIKIAQSITGLGQGTHDTCPSATGLIREAYSITTAGTTTRTFGSKAVNLGTVRGTTRGTTAATATAQMDATARLMPFAFTARLSSEQASSSQVLAFFSNRSRLAYDGTLSGVFDPASGTITGERLTEQVSVQGYGPDADATLRATLRPVLRKTAGSLFDGIRKVEADARAGKCTFLGLRPASPSPLAPNATDTFSASLSMNNREQTTVSSRMTATAAKGTVTPAADTGRDNTFTVKGAAKGPETANIRVRAVSPAGISEATWIGKAAEYPAGYDGTFTTTQVYDDGRREETTGSLHWTKKALNPAIGQTYEITSGQATEVVSGTIASNGCVHSGTTALSFPGVTSLLTLADYSAAEPPPGLRVDPAKPIYFSMTFVSQPASRRVTVTCPGSARPSTDGNTAEASAVVGTPVPSLEPDKALTYGDLGAVAGTVNVRSGPSTITTTWSFVAVP